MFFTIKNRGRRLGGEVGIFLEGRAVGLIEVTFLSLMFLWVWGDAVNFLLARGKKGHPIKNCSLCFSRKEVSISLPSLCPLMDLTDAEKMRKLGKEKGGKD